MADQHKESANVNIFFINQKISVSTEKTEMKSNKQIVFPTNLQTKQLEAFGGHHRHHPPTEWARCSPLKRAVLLPIGCGQFDSRPIEAATAHPS
jgi:hypothetical protein